MYSRSILLLLLFVYCFCDVSGWKFHNQLRNLVPSSKSLKTSWKQIASISTLLTVSIGTFGSQSVFADTLKQIEPTFDEVSTTYSQPVNIPSLRTQLDSIRKEQILEQKTRVQEEEQASLTRAITYPDNYLIARGTITILSQQTKQQYPFGYLRASDNNRALENDKASLYLVAVGKEGPPFAAKRIALSQLSFPYVFEITTDDLLFPYTPQAYAKSVNSQDTVVVSAIFTRDDDLGQIVGNEEFGFGLSEFTTFAGKKVRGLAKLSIDPGLFGTNSKKPLLQEPERQIFQRIGNEIKRREASPSIIASSTTTVSL